MKRSIVTFACIITLFLAYTSCTAQAPGIADSVLYHLKGIRSTADTNHLKAALAWMQKNQEELLFDNEGINKELNRVRTVLGEKVSYQLFGVFFSSQLGINTPAVYKASIKWGKKFIEQFKTSDSKYTYNSLLRLLWELRIPYRNSADIYEGIEYYNALNKKYRDANDSIAVSITYQVIAGFYFRLGLTEESLYNCLKSEDYIKRAAEPIDSLMIPSMTTLRAPLGNAVTLVQFSHTGKPGKLSRNYILGNYLLEANRPSEAEFYLRRAITYFGEMKTPHLVADVALPFIFLARCKSLLKSDSSVYFYNLALHYLKLYNSLPVQFALFYQFKAEDCIRMNQLDSAWFFINQCKSLKDSFKLEAGGLGSLIIPNYYMASLQVKRNNFKAAIDLLTVEIEELRSLNNRRELLEELQLLAQAYNAWGKYKEAFKVQEEAFALKDALESERNNARHLSFTLEKKMQADENRIITLEAESKANKKVRYYFYGIIALLGLLAITLVRGIFTKQKSNRRLATKNNELSLALDELQKTQSQLIQSEKMASLGELTAGIAHEIQNPLNFVNNFSEVNDELLKELKTEAEKGNMEEVKAIAKDIEFNSEKINHHGKRADAIVKGMLQHSRTSNGQKEPTDINALANEYLRLSYHGLRAKDKSFNATMTTNFDETIGKINIIPQDIGRVVLNLINNGFYAVDEKKKQNDDGYEPTVSVSTKSNNGKVEIKVADNGNGIPQKIVDKIFQPFFTTKPTGQGTGLGLSLSYDIVKAHGGELKVETKEGEGSEFIIQLPNKHVER